MDPVAVTNQYVTDAYAAATRVPVDPRTTDHEGLAAARAAFEPIEFNVDGHAVMVSATVASVREVTGTAYLIGGFELVQALDAAVRWRITTDRTAESQLQSTVRTLASLPRGRLRLADIERDVADAKAKLLLTERRMRTANEILRLLHEAWSRIATVEEQVLRDYEPTLIAQFVELTKEAQAIVQSEWARYQPYDPGASDDTPLSIGEAKKQGTEKLRLKNEAEALVGDIRKLHDSWLDYLHALDSTRLLEGLGRLAGADPAAMVANSRANNAKKFEAFDTCRSDVGDRFPAALQVYGRFGTLATSDVRTTDATIEAWVVESLIEAVDSAGALADGATKNPVFTAGTRLRVESSDGDDATSDLAGSQKDLLAQGLTVPATRIIANRMADPDASAKSPWFQLPVRLALFRLGTEGDVFLAPYATPGRLHHAALSEVNNALQEVRRKQKAKQDQALLIIDAIATPAAFFTGGATLAIAGVIHAVVRANEMYLSVKEFQALDALAQIALTPVQQAIWEHPSAVALTGKLLEGGFEIATDLVNSGVAGAILDAVQVSLMIGYGAQAVADWLSADDPLGDD